ncbi:MAG: prepilin-type N-terminal cleavage/methylation domain-containing protein [Bacteroidetes bacterium]|nr:prepilin-type N-terminal cleavage/methylation domain-containing protein [Bacteroidota bacterium]
MKKMNKGFTLVELMVVVIIVGILAAVAVPMMNANRSKAISSELMAGIGSISTAARMYQAEFGVAPAAVTDLTGSGHLALADLEGSYYTADQIAAAAFAIGFTDGKLNNGSTASRGITVTVLDGKITTSGTYQ